MSGGFAPALAAVLLAGVTLTAGGSALAQAPAAVPAPVAPAAVVKPLWKELSQPQQVALAPLVGEWDRMDSARKQKWLDIANRYASMKPDEQQRMHERMREWLKLTPEERRVARENYTLSKKIDKSHKASKWEQYQQLPEEEKRKLAEAAQKKQQLTNLPPTTQPKAVTPIKPVACAAGTVRNPNPAGPACIPGAASPAAQPPVPPAVPVPNAK